jgi:hypothetical protein
MEQTSCKQTVIDNLTLSLEQVRGTELEPLVSAALEAIEQTDSSEEISRITGALQEKLQRISDKIETARSNDSQGKSESELIRDAVSKYSQKIDWICLITAEREKLNEMIDGYAEAVETAQELHRNVEIKPLSAVWRAVAEIAPEIIKDIACFEKPTLLVVPKNSFAEKVRAMNAHKKYPGHQNDVACIGTSYNNVGFPKHTSISIIDGANQIPHLSAIEPVSPWGVRKEFFKKYLQQKNLRLINVHEYALLQQLSLRNFQNSHGNTNLLIDFLPFPSNTTTCLDDEYLVSSPDEIAQAYFNWENCNVRFSYGNPSENVPCLRARPAITILEY